MTTLKKYFIVCCSVAFLTACGGGSSEGNKSGDSTAAKTEEKPAADASDISANPDYQKGLELIGKSDCLTCHDVATKKIGPAYQEVADKYASAGDTIVTHLAKKVIAGGTGVWGTVPMTPHPAVSQADAEQMVKYVLLLKTK